MEDVCPHECVSSFSSLIAIYTWSLDIINLEQAVFLSICHLSANCLALHFHVCCTAIVSVVSGSRVSCRSWLWSVSGSRRGRPPLAGMPSSTVCRCSTGRPRVSPPDATTSGWWPPSGTCCRSNSSTCSQCECPGQPADRRGPTAARLSNTDFRSRVGRIVFPQSTVSCQSFQVPTPCHEYPLANHEYPLGRYPTCLYSLRVYMQSPLHSTRHQVISISTIGFTSLML